MSQTIFCFWWVTMDCKSVGHCWSRNCMRVDKKSEERLNVLELRDNWCEECVKLLSVVEIVTERVLHCEVELREFETIRMWSVDTEEAKWTMSWANGGTEEMVRLRDIWGIVEWFWKQRCLLTNIEYCGNLESNVESWIESSKMKLVTKSV